MRELLGSHAVWNVNSTAAGGGVAEMLRSLLALRARRSASTRAGSCIEGRRRVLPHHQAPAQRAARRARRRLAARARAERALYERVTARQRRGARSRSCARATSSSVTIRRPPGSCPHLARAARVVVWRCHIGHDRAERARSTRGWAFLRPYLEAVAVSRVLARRPTRRRGSPAQTRDRRCRRASIRSRRRTRRSTTTTVARDPRARGLIERAGADGLAVFMRDDGTPGASIATPTSSASGARPRWETPLVVQVSRWDG